MSKVGRNDPCPCGSGKKFKKCCLDAGFPGGSDPIQLNALDAILQRGYTLLHRNNYTGACMAWLQLWQSLKPIAESHNALSVEDLDNVLQSSPRFYNWCQEFEEALWNAAMEKPEFHKERARYTREFVDALPGSPVLVIQNMMKAEAESWFFMGQPEKGERLFAQLIEKYPDWAWGYIGWGDMYGFVRPKDMPPDYERARMIYEAGLSAPVDEPAAVQERLDDLASAVLTEASLTHSIRVRVARLGGWGRAKQPSARKKLWP